jgi:uncharacterized protein
MDTFRLGKTNMMVTRLGFGGIPIQRLSDDEAVAVVKRSIELGINFIDTANSYTNSERRIGLAIKGKRDKLILATKSASRSPEDIRKHLQNSLTQLGTDYIDLYQFHSVSDMNTLDKVMEPGGVLSVIEEAKSRGLVKHIGITSHQIDVAKKAMQTDRFETVMFPFNFVTSEVADELLPLCRQHDVGFICMKPLAGGKIDNASICFKYLFQFPDIIPIPGIEKISEIEEIVKILEFTPKLTRADKREMEKIKETLGSKFCHRCDYCQPCTSGIPISLVLDVKSMYKRVPVKRFEELAASAMEKASHCVECGECETRCPYKLPIKEMIKEHLEWYRSVPK